MLDEAIRLAECGFSVIWLKPRSKAPREAKWSTLPTLTVEELEETYQKGFNAGVRLGKHSKIGKKYLHAVDMDIRDENYTEIAKKIVKRTFELDLDDYPTVLSGSGGDSRHFYLLLDEPVASTKLWHSDEKMVDDDGKEHWCAEVELFGTGKQVVIPPSVHPDTGKRYAWAKEFDDRDLPVIDMDLVRAATEADEYEDADNDEPLGMTADEVARAIAKLQPWADDHDTWRDVGMAVKHELGMKDGWPVFDEWSKRGRGYNKGDNRLQFRAFKNDRKRKITMRSVMMEVNKEDAAIAADEFLEEAKAEAVIEPKHEPNMLPKAVAFSILDEECGRVERPVDPMRGVPKELLTVPGVLGLAVEHYNANAASYQPQFAVQATLALGSVLFARNYITDQANYTSAYFVGLGETGSGKESMRTFVTRVLEEAKLNDLIGPEKYASEPGVISALKFAPRHLTVIDEFGKVLGSGKNSANTNANDAITAIISMFGIQDGSFRQKSYSAIGKSAKQVASEKNAVIVQPAITLLGLSTPDTFFDILGSADIADGFINRLLVVNTRMPRSVSKPRRWKKMPDKLKNFIKRNVKPGEIWEGRDYLSEEDKLMNDLNEEFDKRDDPAEIPFSKAADRYLDEIGLWVNKEQDALDKYRLAGMMTRCKEIAQRISLIVAISCRSDRVEIEHLEWAWKYVRFYTMEMVEMTKQRLGSNPIIRTADALAERIERADKGLTVREMTRLEYSFRNLSDRDKKEALAHLTSVHDIAPVNFKASEKGGRETIRYMTREAESALRSRGKKRDIDDLA